MKNEPCVRFGIRMRPKISENPAESRKSRPPSVMLLTASTATRFRSTDASFPTGRSRGSASALQRRIVARVDRLREEPLLVVRPELAHVRIRLDRRIDELVALALAAPDVEGPDDVAQVVEVERTARRVRERHGAQRLDKGVAVLRLAGRLLERGKTEDRDA